MPTPIKLSELLNELQETIEERFEGETFWIKAEITDVKKYADKRWCFLKFIEKENNYISTEMKAVFWANSYNAIDRFEKFTKQSFSNGLEITCNVRIRFHQRYGLNIEVLDIDYSYMIGQIEIEKQKTLDRLLAENPQTIKLVDGKYFTLNKVLELPIVIQNIALITAPESDGQRDFIKELETNQYGYKIFVTQFATMVQGDKAHENILQQLHLIKSNRLLFDAIAIVRGGGSQTDFKSFDNYDLAKCVAEFPVPIFTGIGHDRNTSITDMMARELKTPTKVAAFMVDYNFSFEQKIVDFKNRFFNAVDYQLQTSNENLKNIKRLLKSYDPVNTLKKGYAIVMHENKIITNAKSLKATDEIQTLLQDEIINSTVTKKSKQKS